MFDTFRRCLDSEDVSWHCFLHILNKQRLARLLASWYYGLENPSFICLALSRRCLLMRHKALSLLFIQTRKIISSVWFIFQWLVGLSTCKLFKECFFITVWTDYFQDDHSPDVFFLAHQVFSELHIHASDWKSVEGRVASDSWCFVTVRIHGPVTSHSARHSIAWSTAHLVVCSLLYITFSPTLLGIA